ncbi:MAG: hypothetical protein DRJ64_10365 [Thermoprotei archaeon]|nr:MAG: hypothetical protein DRJ64_10365 [Thermoprotei archaeon]
MAVEEKELEEQTEELELEEEEDIAEEVANLKERIDTIESEIKNLSNILKNTVLDVRNLISEIDNPFSFLKTIGVDKLVDKAMETAEEEVSKAKREKLKDAVKKDPYDEKPKIISATVSSAGSNTGSAGGNGTGNNGYNNTTVLQPGGPSSEIQRSLPGDGNNVSAKLLSQTLSGNGRSNGRYRAKKRLSSVTVNVRDGLSTQMMRLIVIASYIVLRYGVERGLELVNDYIVEGIVEREIGIELKNLISIFAKMNSIRSTGVDEQPFSSLEDQIILISLLNNINVEYNEFLETLFYLLFIKSSISYLFLLREES